MILPAGIFFGTYYDEEIIELEAEPERILFRYDPNAGYTIDSEYFDLTWKWGKESFVLTNGGIHYDNNTSMYSEVKFTCKKK